jgi:hypothetical protein
MGLCFCTLAIHAPYRERARQLCQDLMGTSIVVLTDKPGDFDDLPVRAIFHQPTGPMAVDYRERLAATGNSQGAAAYHDKRFALMAALEVASTALFLDADSRVAELPNDVVDFPPGLCVLPVVRRSVAGHLAVCGTWRWPHFQDVALKIHGSDTILEEASWCHESCVAVTKDGSEDKFFDVWGQWAQELQKREVYSGEGGVIGIASFSAGWRVDYSNLHAISRHLSHEGGGPKGGVTTL